MANIRSSRHGSMQFWPRVRAKNETPSVHAVSSAAYAGGFSGYKVGMTHVSFKDKGANSMTKGLVIIKPVTIIECPPLKVAGIRFYKMVNGNLAPSSDVFADKLDKELGKRMIVPKGKELKETEFDDLRLIVYTQPKNTSLSKKVPEVFELALGGKKEQKLVVAKEKLGKEITVADVLKVNELVDIHAVTTGKGFQGPVKRFGVALRSHKAEKTKRGPASLGPWRGYFHFMYRVAHAGHMGYHQRTELNKAVVMIDSDPAKITPSGGFVGYGNVKNTYILLMGSVPGPVKRLIRLVPSIRPNLKKRTDALTIVKIDTTTKQRR